MVRPKKKSARRTICCCILSGSTTKWPVLPNTTNAESSENIFRFPSVAVRDYTIRPVRKFRIENGSKHPVFDTRIFQVQLTQKLFAVLAACMSVSRTRDFWQPGADIYARIRSHPLHRQKTADGSQSDPSDLNMFSVGTSKSVLHKEETEA